MLFVVLQFFFFVAPFVRNWLLSILLPSSFCPNAGARVKWVNLTRTFPLFFPFDCLDLLSGQGHLAVDRDTVFTLTHRTDQIRSD